MTIDTISAVTDFLKGERNWIQREMLIQSLLTLGKHGGADWPRFTRELIDEAVEALVDRKEVVESPYGLRWHNTLFVTPAVAAKRPVMRKPEAPVNSDQGTLF